MALKKCVMLCKSCKKEFIGDKSRKFCCLSCATFYNNKGTKLTEFQKQKISNSLKEYYKIHKCKTYGDDHSKRIGATTKGKYKQSKIRTLYEVSSRTRSKIISRLNIKCCICGWNEDKVDIHHIIARRNKGSDELTNLTPLCPNHHRLAERGKLDSKLFVTLDKIITEEMLNTVYFG